jgi:hypothetical protein
LTEIPDVIAGEIDVFPAKRRKVGRAFGGHGRSLPFEGRDGLLQIDGIQVGRRINWLALGYTKLNLAGLL